MAFEAYELKQREDGRYEVIDKTVSTPYPIGATNWATKSDAEFIHSFLNQAFAAGVATTMKLKEMLDKESPEAAKSAPAAPVDPDAVMHRQNTRVRLLELAVRGREGWSAADILAAAKDLEKYVLE